MAGFLAETFQADRLQIFRYARIQDSGWQRIVVDHLPQCFDFRKGKMYPRTDPGLGVEFDPRQAELVLEITERDRPIPIYQRPDGSVTNW